MKLNRFVGLCASLIALSLLYGCGSGGSTGAFDSPATYFSTIQDLTVEVAYEPGAEPFAGKIQVGPLSGQTYFSILEENLKAIFQGRDVAFSIPKELSEMTALPAQNKTSWTTAELLSTAAKYRKNTSTKGHAYFFIIFVNGYLDSDRAPQPNVIGVNIKGTSVLAIFKQVVTSTGQAQSGPVPKYVEQASIVHEVGHVLGLVNNGVPMVNGHQDTANGAHCTNANCVMYYLNTGLEAAQKFANQLASSGSKVMYGSECLLDTKTYSPD